MSEDPFGYDFSETEETKPAPKKATPAAKSERKTGLASNGKPVVTDQYKEPPLPTWENRDHAYQIDEFTEVDFSDLSRINSALNQVRIKFYRIGRELKQAQRMLSDAKTSYSRRMRRELVNMSGGTEKTRVAMAEIACEEWENDVAVTTQLVAELTNEQRIVSKELDILESLANNARAQIKIM